MKAKKIIGILAILVLLAASAVWYYSTVGPVTEEVAEETNDWIIFRASWSAKWAASWRTANV